MGSATPARSMDSGEDCSQHSDVGSRLDAYTLSAGGPGAAAAAKLLRRERLAAAARVDRACLPVSAHEPALENAGSSDRSDPGPTLSGTSHPAAASGSG